jgi:hypothetical protein
MINRLLIALIVFSVAGDGYAQGVKKAMRAERKYTLDPGGTFILENPIGDIEITGANIPDIEASIVTTIAAADEAAFQEAQRHAGLLEGGDSKTRVVRTTAVPVNYRQRPWSVSVRWSVRLPRSASVRVVSYSSGTIQIANILGDVNIKNFNGNIRLTNLNAGTFAESVNGQHGASSRKRRALDR